MVKHKKSHKRTHNKPFECETCLKKFAVNSALRDHQMYHGHGICATAPEKTFDCDKCAKSFSITKTRMHQRSVHDTEEVNCEVCNKALKNRYLLSRHRHSHVKVECPICNQIIAKPKITTLMKTHSTRSPFECDLCDHSFKGKIHIKQHIKRKHLLRRLLNDSECRDDFTDFALLERLQLRHGSLATIGEKKFKCDKCCEEAQKSYPIRQ